MVEFRDVISKVGMEALNAGSFVGRKAVEAYKAVDPDVMRHVAQLPLLSYTLFVSKREEIEPGTPDGHPPLIFVHGLGGDRGNFLLMAWYFWLMGRKRSYRIHFEPGRPTEQMASLLAEFIIEVKKVTGEDRVDLVAHSLGGIVARLAISDHDLAPSVKTLITLGTPHKGTYAARYANTKMLRDIRPDSDLIKRLNNTPWPEGVRGATFWSRNDLLVLPAESAIMEGTEQVDITPFTHYSYLISPKCWILVERELMR